MLTASEQITTMIKSPVRKIDGRVDIYNGSTLLETHLSTNNIKKFTIERVGDNTKFSGFGICQKLNLHLIDKDRTRNYTTANTLDVAFGVNGEYTYPYPLFKISRVNRDDKTGELSITAYDALYEASNHTIAEIEGWNGSYLLRTLAQKCAAFLGLTLKLMPNYDTADNGFYSLSYPEGANLDGSETIRAVLDAMAEVNQMIYYIDGENNLVFKRLLYDKTIVVDAISRDDYFELEVGDNRRLTAIGHITELGDNIAASTTEIGTTQYIRDNPFLELRDDVGSYLEYLIRAVGGFTITQFDCKCRGNYLYEIGDRLWIKTKDGVANSNFYVLDDVITYDGTLSEVLKWQYNGSEAETEANPSNLGEALKQTFARVDKANKKIELVAGEAAANAESIASLALNTESITASIESIQTETAEALGSINGNISTLTNKVEAQITAEDVSLSITSALSNGVTKVETETGFTFNEAGLTVSKSNSEISTQITEDGMKVYREEEAVLIANNVGVEARNLQATTYLIIGGNSRFENYGSNRTGCFWIGG